MNTPMRALIVDDELPGRAFLRELLRREPQVEVVGECSNGLQALQWLESQDTDVIFLDVRMPELDGFETLARLDVENRPAVVMVTAYDEFALRAFHFEAWDYLLKPFDETRLRQTLQRVQRRMVREASARALGRDLSIPLTTNRRLERLAVPEGKGRVTIRVRDVDWFEAESNYVAIHLGDRSYLVRTSLGDLENRLDPEIFVRIHRSAIVNVDRIAKLEPRGHGDLSLFLVDGRELSMSRRYRTRLESILLTLS